MVDRAKIWWNPWATADDIKGYLNDKLPEKLSELGVSVGEWEVVDVARGEEDSPPTVTLQATLPGGERVRVRVRLRDRRKDELARDLTERLRHAKELLEAKELFEERESEPAEEPQSICSNTEASWEVAG